MSMEISGLNYNIAAVGGAAPAASAGAVNAEELAAQEKAQTPKNQEAATFEYRQKGANAVDSETIKSMQDDLEARTQNLVRQMMGQQADNLATADSDFWNKIRTGQFKVTPEQQAEAQKNIAEDGYWGVEQTSERFIKYAEALAGGDPDRLEKVISGFQKGMEEAEKMWGGELPELSQKTYDVTMEKFEKMKEQYGIGANAAMGVQA